MPFGRDARIALATAVFATGVPWGARAWVRARTDDVAARLTAAGGVPARIGGIDADLTGSIRLTDVALGDLVAVDAIEASVAMGSLLDGELRADEIRVTAPRVSIELSSTGDSPLAALARRFAGRGRSGPGARASSPSRLRRIVVDEGSLTARIAGVGELTADHVELVPDEYGVRVIAGRIRLRGGAAGVTADLAFARCAAELAMPTMRFGRALAVGGGGTLATAGGSIAITELAAGRLTAGGAIELRGFLDDAGVPRTIAVDLAADRVAVTGDRIPLGLVAAVAPRGLAIEHAHATGTVVATRGTSPTGPTLHLRGDGAVTGAVITHPTLAAEPIAADAAVRGDVTVARDSVVIASAGIDLGTIRITAAGWLRREGSPAGQLDATLAPAACSDLLAAVPAVIRGPLDGLLLDGIVGASARLAVDLSAPEGQGVTITGAIVGGCTALNEAPAADVTTLAKPGHQQLADGTRRHLDPADETYQSLGRLPGYVAGAFTSAEDGRYWSHRGFDVEQIARSFEIDLREQRLARGGSTISQQLVKNAFLSRRRTLDRKLQEAVLTWRLEARLEKSQILERYLNIIELGPRVFGIRAAALHWFERAPRDLLPRQAAFLAALTSQPTSMSRRVRKTGGLDAESAERVAVVMRAMKRDGVISTAVYDEARGEPLGFAATALAE